MEPARTATERKTLLLEHPDVKTWVDDRSAGSASTQLDHLRIFLEKCGLDVDRLVGLAMKDERKFKWVVQDFIRDRQESGLSAKYVENIWWSLRSFLRSVNAAPGWNPKVRETAADEEDAARIVPSHDQVRQIADTVKSARDRMIVLLLASSGVRTGTFGNQNGHADGLRLKHLIDLKLDPEPRFEHFPPMLRIPAHLAKSNAAYYTGKNRPADDAEIAYLKERQARGEKLVMDSPLVVPDGRGVRESRKTHDGFEVVMRKSLASRLQAAIDVVFPGDNRPTPHALRAFFSTQLEAAEARGLISRTRRFYFTAHRLGGVDEGYNLSRPLPPSKVEELRREYAKVVPFLESGEPKEDRATVLEGVTAAVLKAMGVKDEKIAEVLEGRVAGKELERILDARKAEPVERLVPKDRLSALLHQGWEFVSAVGTDQAVVRWSHGEPVTGPQSQ